MKTWKLFTTSDGGISAEGPEISIDLEVEVIEKSAYDEVIELLKQATDGKTRLVVPGDTWHDRAKALLSKHHVGGS